MRAGPRGRTGRGRVTAGCGSSAAYHVPEGGPNARPRPGAGESWALGGSARVWGARRCARETAPAACVAGQRRWR